MHWMTFLGLLFIALFLVVLPIVELPAIGRLKRFTSSALRVSMLRSTIVKLWIGALAVVALAYPNNPGVLPRTATDIGWLLAHPVVRIGAIATICAYCLLAIVPGLRCAIDPPTRARNAKMFQRLQFMLPVSDAERRWWWLVSITAGVCEELIFRGYLIRFFHGQLDGALSLSLTAAWLLSSLAFGFGHVYQGAAGIVSTTIGGLLLGLLAILTGNLILPILLHVLLDLQTLWMYRPRIDHPEHAERLVQGCEGLPAVQAVANG